MKQLITPLLQRSRLADTLLPTSLPSDSPLKLGRASANSFIGELIRSGQPSMISRFGRSELAAITRYQLLSQSRFSRKLFSAVITGEYPRWGPSKFSELASTAGVFPVDDRSTIEHFVRVCLAASRELDFLGSWVPGENLLRELPQDLYYTDLANLEPFFVEPPWTKALEGKKVLVIHPFKKSIESQYARRDLLFADPDFLPEFELITLKPPQTTNAIENASTIPYPDWKAAYSSICRKMRAVDFDVALIGAGGYGMPLAAEAKRMGKVAVHLGGSTQLLFGIWGRRWERDGRFRDLRNKYWVRPRVEEVPGFVWKNEDGGAYY